MSTITTEVTILGGGVMGLLTAYKLRQQNLAVVIIDAENIGGAQAASYGITRSIRNDYGDPVMAKMANDAYKGWQQLEADWGTTLIDPCGCLNIFSNSLSGIAVDESYATNSAKWLARDKRRFEVFSDKKIVQSKWSQLAVDFAVLDVDAGMAFPRKVMSKLLEFLRTDPGVVILENTKIQAIEPATNVVTVRCNRQEITTRKVVVTAGLGSIDVCEKITSFQVKLPIKADRPFELKYFFTDEQQYNSKSLPVLAFLDVGIYAHPMVDGVTPAVKVGYYSPPGIELSVDDSVAFIDRFVEECLPTLAKNGKSQIITDVDQCSYDMTPDNKFILGYLGADRNVIVAAGFNGTGYKFAPAISGVVSQLVQEKAVGYDISEFDPNRFLNQKGVS